MADSDYICGAAWIYNPVYAHPPHANHACGLLAGHKPEDDGAIIHQCASCKCWANDLLIKAQRTLNRASP